MFAVHKTQNIEKQGNACISRAVIYVNLLRVNKLSISSNYIIYGTVCFYLNSFRLTCPTKKSLLFLSACSSFLLAFFIKTVRQSVLYILQWASSINNKNNTVLFTSIFFLLFVVLFIPLDVFDIVMSMLMCLCLVQKIAEFIEDENQKLSMMDK